VKPQAACSRYTGDFVAWRGGCGFLGSGGRGTIATHSHYAIQLVIGVPSGLKVQFGRTSALTECVGALVPSGLPHTIDVDACEWAAVLFVEPETTEGRALTAMLDGQGRVLEPEAVLVAANRLQRAWRSGKDPGQVGTLCLQLVRDLAQASSREPTDPRVLAAIRHIQDKVDQPISLEEVAALANLSPSRFRQLFVAETGMPLRTYLLWRRLLHVWTLLMQGQSLAAAAHAAGFADSAHLSRTARTMFGLPPSSMQMSGPLSARLRAAPRHLG